MNRIKALFLNLTGKAPKQIGQRARVFNNWLADIESGWLANYDLKNIVVFDYYDILTGEGKSNWTKYPTREGRNSHPSSKGNNVCANNLITFLNRVVHYSRIL